MLPLKLFFGVKDCYSILKLFLELGIINKNTFKMENIMDATASLLDSLKTTFETATGNGNNNGNNKPNSEYWLNIGYEVDGHFVSLPKGGVPLDNMEGDKVSNPDSEYGQLLIAQNFLLEQIKEVANTFQPGEAQVLKGLVVQLRRKKASIDVPLNEGASKFIRKLF